VGLITRLHKTVLAGVLVFGLLLALAAATIFRGGERDQNVGTPVEDAVLSDFVWGDNCSVLGSCSDNYPASDVACDPTGETLRGTPVYWCSVSFGDNRRTGACVNLAGGDLAMSGPVIQEKCSAQVANARTDRFFTEADDLLP
jgi:hypothetical protein